jgi:glycosyltransferase involved in cell wall biosynthesis
MTPHAEVRVLATAAQALTAPGFRARVLLLRPELLRYGIRVDPLPLFTEREAGAFAGGGPRRRTAVLLGARRRMGRQLADSKSEAYDVAMIQRQADLLPPLRLERRVADSRRLIWDVDDAIWLDSSPAAGGHRLAALKGTARKVRWLAARADHIVAANVYLADFVSRYSSRISIVPSVVETRGVPSRRHADGPEIVLGWIGSATTGRYLQHLSPLISRVSRELRPMRVRLVIIGAKVPTTDGFVAESAPWSVDRELEALKCIDVGLMPMPDDDWTRGKSAYKALQYMSAGIPVVADDVGVTSSVIDSDGAGFVVRGEEEWVEALTTLARDSELRGRLGEYGRRRVEGDFSVRRWSPVMSEILRGERVPKAELQGANREKAHV